MREDAYFQRMTMTLFVPAAPDRSRIARRMGQELRTLGHDVSIVELTGRFPDPDQAAIYAARSAWSSLPPDAPKLIAGDVLAAFAGLPPHHVTVLVQRPPEADASLLREVRRVVAPSEAMQIRLARDYGAPADRIAIIPPGIDRLPRSPGSGERTCRILSVGALIPRKGHDVLLRALSRLFDLDWTLTIAGAPDDRTCADGLTALAEELQIDRRVAFTGSDVTEELWTAADLFTLASNDEGYGLPIAQALRRGLPVAVTNVGAVPTLVGPEAGVVCVPRDADQLSKALRRLIFDRTLRHAMADVAWQTGQALPSWPDQAQKLAEIIG